MNLLLLSYTYFNPRSRGGSDTKAIFIETLGNPISIHAPAEGATCRLRHHIKGGKFQSTLPRRERPTCICKTSPIRYFNPRSRGGSDSSFRPIHLMSNNISIHAPAEGATACIYTMEWGFPISIHAPAEGATICPYFRSISLCTFQSTLPRRERHAFITSVDYVNNISIHAPAEGATTLQMSNYPICS